MGTDYERDNEVIDVRLTRRDYEILQQMLRLDSEKLAKIQSLDYQILADQQLKIKSLRWSGRWVSAFSVTVLASIASWFAFGESIIKILRGLG